MQPSSTKWQRGDWGIVMILIAVLCSATSAQLSKSSANDFVHRVVMNELKAESEDHSHWMFRLDTQKPNAAEEVDEVVETNDGDLKYPILINGQKLTEEQRQRAETRIQHIAKDPGELRKSLHEKAHDEAHSQRMLKLLPQAFLFEYGARSGNLVQLNFTPDPHFRPSNREATVFHAM